MSRKRKVLALTLVAATAAGGCATKKYVRQQSLESEERTAERIEVLQSQMENVEMDIARHDEEIQALSATTQDALDRAIAAGKLAEGKFVFERVLSSDELRFDFDQSDLSDAVKTALDEFGAELVERNENLYIEVQGHTDASGPDDYNLKLGQARAEAVRRYLNDSLEIPLHRIGVISYGETAPIVDNDTRENRARNRRVALVVLK